MKKSRNDIGIDWTNDRRIAVRHARIHLMVGELLAEIEPDRYKELLENLHAEYQPVGAETRLVEILADAMCRIRGCFYLETKILNDNIKACTAAGEAPEMAVGRAYIRDFEGAQMLEKIARYESSVSTLFSRCLRTLTDHLASRRRRDAIAADALAKRKPCTSVVQ